VVDELTATEKRNHFKKKLLLVLKTDTDFTSQERNPVFEGKYKTTSVSDLMTE
jgi:hypothetical protein